MRAEIPNSRGRHLQSFCTKECTLQLEVAAVSSQFACRRHDSMTRDVAALAVAHDVPDRARGTRPARGFRDITVGGNAADRDTTDDIQHGAGEWGRHESSPVFGFRFSVRTQQ